MEKLEKNLRHHCHELFGNSLLQEVYEYALFPTGKLFRPLLALSSASDLGVDLKELENPNSGISRFASALEIHHVYTLLHDDLPCMDDDDTRRGRPSGHKKFNEWKALLAGDGMSVASFDLMARIPCSSNPSLLRVATYSLGPRGLIEGQVLDLGKLAAEGFELTQLIHRKKTARLIQLALLGPALIYQPKDRKNFVSLARLGESMGLLFQYLDDLLEWDGEIGEHELAINPWIHHQERVLSECLRHFERVEKLIGNKEKRKVFSRYIMKVKKKWEETAVNRRQFFNGADPSMPLVTVFDSFC